MACTQILMPFAWRWSLFLLISNNLFKLLVAAADLTDTLNSKHLTVAFIKTVCININKCRCCAMIFLFNSFRQQTQAQVKIIRDAAGRILDVSGVGPSMLSWLSIEYNFTYFTFLSLFF